jgi:DNA-binding response OmpR family regulator
MSKKPRILFVDDDDALRTTFSMGLEAAGYAVDSVSST